jgi:sec-independent protein translocase protein TatB
MFDVGWSEILVIAVVAILVVGPKELPKMLRTFGKTMGTVRRTANDFKRQFDEALREAERQADLEDTRKELQAIARTDPLAGVKKDLDQTMRPVNGASPPAPAKPATPPVPDTATAPHEAEPLKTGATGERGSDAA